MDDQINLDVHAINDLQKRGFPPTDDSAKYKYTADGQGIYSMYGILANTVWNSSILSFHRSLKNNTHDKICEEITGLVKSVNSGSKLCKWGLFLSKVISMVLCKNAINLSQHWRYCILALRHGYILLYIYIYIT